jgi:hypothetical protein
MPDDVPAAAAGGPSDLDRADPAGPDEVPAPDRRDPTAADDAGSAAGLTPSTLGAGMGGAGAIGVGIGGAALASTAAASTRDIDPSGDAMPAAARGAPSPIARPRSADDGGGRRRSAVLLLPLLALTLLVLAGAALIGMTRERGVLPPAGASGGAAIVPVSPSPSRPPSATTPAIAARSTAPSPSPSPSPTPSPTATATASAPATAAPPPTPKPTARATPQPTPKPTPRPTKAPAPGPTTAGRSPAETVARFYSLVEQHRFSEAARLWSPRMRAQYPPSGYINGRFTPTTSIDIQRLSTRSEKRANRTATVFVDLLEHRTNGETRHWVGTWDLVLTSSGWLMDRPHL